MRRQGSRIDDLTIEGKPNYFRIIRFGNFSRSEPSEEIIVNVLDLEDIVRRGQAILDERSSAKK